jgi:phosphinothricin acetyltransferase
VTPTIRLAARTDAVDVADIYAPVVERTHISFETTPPSADEVGERIDETVTELPWLVCEHDDRIAGYAYASRHEERPAYQWGVDVSVYVHERWRRRGVARGLYESLFELLERQGLYTAYAVIALPNAASVGFHESFGFERVGRYRNAGYKNGEWHDVGHWERSIREVEDPPSPLAPLSDLRGSDGWDAALSAGESSVEL